MKTSIQQLKDRIDTKDFTLWPKMVNVNVGKVHVNCKNGFPGDGSVIIDGKEYKGVQRVVVTLDANSNEPVHVDLRVYPDHFQPIKEKEHEKARN